ncbi:hypothetical protein Q8A64_10825 [Oxalobacteraceae bacterium R-40]|uniref:Uncharacterized protein n=1 Tax=Keguizhuia sedimenti TaxID=3064264 RepID=A0ABU1BRI7_9BURK|nr:hypothetical protein [Oxalobacteraceae bacterium R-40]
MSKFLFLAGLSLASFALFLHSMDPVEFLRKAIFSPRDAFQTVYGYVQTVVFWISAGFMTAGIAGILVIVFQRWRTKHFFSRVSAQQTDACDGEENWMFL